MNSPEFEELAGRIEGIGEALLNLTAALEMQGLIEGPRLSASWRDAVHPGSSDTPLRQAALRTLKELTVALDGARSQRQSLGRR